MPKLFQIYEKDLSDLEHTLPEIAEAMSPVLNNRLRVQLRRVQSILSSIRWNYGPPSEVRVIPVDGEADQTL
jgi:hypothetical protein